MAIKKNAAEGSAKEIKVTRVKQFFEDGSFVFDMDVNGVSIYGCRIVEGKKGDFVSFPSRKGKDNKYYSYVYVKLADSDIENVEDQINSLL